MPALGSLPVVDLDVALSAFVRHHCHELQRHLLESKGAPLLFRPEAARLSARARLKNFKEVTRLYDVWPHTAESRSPSFATGRGRRGAVIFGARQGACAEAL